MKITIDIDCTPQEARSFMGLPDVKPMQDELIARMQGRMARAIDEADIDSLFKSWMPLGIQGMEAMQRMMWESMTGQQSGQSEGGPKDSKSKD